MELVLYNIDWRSCGLVACRLKVDLLCFVSEVQEVQQDMLTCCVSKPTRTDDSKSPFRISTL